MFISELFEGKSQVPKNPEQKQGPAGQARGPDKAPFRNKLVGEASAHAKEVAKKRAEYERVQDKKRDARGETYNVGNAKAVKPPKTEAMERQAAHADPDFSKPIFGEGDNPQDEITVDVPLLIRLLEYAREDAKTDMDLHNVAENLIKLSGQGCLSMQQYEQIVGGMKEMAPGRQAYAGRRNVPGMTA